ncbi:hypothetical protein E4T52_03229 [Aureobasidium sp. EXF-3400]|nr:hypothetical protein E4T51_02318 [Aureobasidium sp. EXF-12344]KAI4781903.1 hypothetical protein E4T52_03229 [Aureobasidium sp. EXF-3400]
MRFPSFLLATVAGLWQQTLVSEEETVTSTRHIHVTRTITNFHSTIYAVRMGSSTLYMEYIPATLATKSSPWQAPQATHLELRAEATSTMHIKVTQTVAPVGATVFASKVGTSISTITNAPQSLIEQAAEDAAELSSSQLAAAISSAKADALTHSTVALLASTTPSSTLEPSAPPSPSQPEPAQFTNSSSSPNSTQSAAASPSSNGGSETIVPIGLELRSNGGTTTNVQPQVTTIQAPSTVTVVVYSSSPTAATSLSRTMEHSAALSQASTTLASSIAQPTTSSGRSIQTTQTTQSTQSVPTPVAVDTNAAQVKSIQTALIQPSTYSDEAAATSASASSSTTAEACSENCASQISVPTVVSTSYSSSTSSNRVYTIPVTLTGTTSTPSADSTVVPSAAQTSGSAASPTSYGAQSSDSAAADIAADNAAGASGGDSGSFKLSKGGFAAIISVVSVGVGLGIIFLVLFVVAKRRQWKVRQSIARASRRITGRFSSHPNKTALRSEKEPTLPIIEPRQPLGPRPAPSSRRHQGFANIDATLHSNYRGVETVGRSASRGPEAWRRAMAKERLQQSQSQRKKPELRVDTGAAARMEEGRRGQQAQKKKGDWKDLFRAL